MPSERRSLPHTLSLKMSILYPSSLSSMSDRFILEYPAPGRMDLNPMRFIASTQTSYSCSVLTTRSMSLVKYFRPVYIIEPPPRRYR